MPSVSGVSGNGTQLIIGPSTITGADFDIVFPGLLLNLPTRVGYGWVVVRQNAAPNYRWLLWQGPIYAPGWYSTFPNNFGFTNFQYGLYVDWNMPGLNYTVTI